MCASKCVCVLNFTKKINSTMGTPTNYVSIIVCVCVCGSLVARGLLALAHSACLVHRQPGFAR